MFTTNSPSNVLSSFVLDKSLDINVKSCDHCILSFVSAAFVYEYLKGHDRDIEDKEH